MEYNETDISEMGMILSEEMADWHMTAECEVQTYFNREYQSLKCEKVRVFFCEILMKCKEKYCEK